MSATKNDVRKRVFHAIVRVSGEHPDFKAAMESLGFFTAMALIDAIVDQVLAADDLTEDGAS